MNDTETPSDCTCTDHAKSCLQKVQSGKVSQVGRFGVDADGNQMCTVDSFGFRGRFTGECDACYKRQVDGYNKEMAGTWDD
jgi:hypothetical protein